ncbi:MAG: hypothetical protein CM15mV40_180 [Caudoviricetes sp.]|nr:MAG: hypothetical protein CM15mV40_180 [Caudoviricetes sp.]
MSKWVVFSSPPSRWRAKPGFLSLFGCAPYQGFLPKQDALEFPKSVEKGGFLILTLPEWAYSTLGVV